MMKAWQVVVVSLGLLSSSSLISQTVEIPDAGLQVAIREALGKPTGEITVEDMESLTELDASLMSRGYGAPLIESLEGLEAAKNLSRLDLEGKVY